MHRSLVVILLLAGCAPTPESTPTATARQAIVGGALDAATDTVFLLDLRFSNGDAAICSAVLVSPRTLLTAAHCVDPAQRNAASVTVVATNKDTVEGLRREDTIPVTLVSRHPQWNGQPSSANDIAMLLLETAPAGLSPVPVVRALPSGLVGRPLRVVGYGLTRPGGDDSGYRRSVSSTVTAVGASTIEFGVAGTSGICAGDSGGPSLVTVDGGVEAVVGIHSLTRSPSCGSGTDIRVDAKLPFIDGFITANDAPQCGPDARCAVGCASPDPDCGANCQANGVCTVGCATPDPDCCSATDGRCDATCPAGGVDLDCLCRGDGRCETGCPAGRSDPDCACLADGRCESTCPAGRDDPDCGCDDDGVCLARCPVDPDCADCAMNGVCSADACPDADPDCLADGAVCTADGDCEGRRCLPDPRGFRFCSRACFEAAECQLDLVCSGGVCASQASLGEGVEGGCTVATGPWTVLFLLWLGGWRRRA